MTFRVIRGGREDGTPRRPARGRRLGGRDGWRRLRTRGGQGDVGRLTAADAGGTDSPAAPVVAVWEGRVVAAGPRSDVERFVEGEGFPLGRFARLDAVGGAVTPGLIDPHAPVVRRQPRGRARAAAARRRLRGILAAGGGILDGRADARRDRRRPRAHGRRWLDEMLTHGTTTIEAKSGYSLDLKSELRLLEVAHELGTAGPVDVVPTYLGAHAVPPEFRDRPNGVDAYVRNVVEEQRRAWPPGPRARFCDVFCEEACSRPHSPSGSFSPARRSVSRHACMPTSSCRPAARSWRRRSARCPRRPLWRRPSTGIDALAAAAADGQPVVATVLPATTWFLSRAAPARTFIDRGIPVAIGTDLTRARPRRRRCRSR